MTCSGTVSSGGRRRRLRRQVRAGLMLALLAASGAPAGAGPLSIVSESEKITAVSSKVYNGYARKRLPDGSVRPEDYVFGNGGFLTQGLVGLEGSTSVYTRDDTIDNTTFGSVARILVGPLAEQGYVLSFTPGSTDLFIMVFWGRSIGTNAFPGSDFANSLPQGWSKDRVDLENAKLLGFDSEGVFAQGFNDPTNMMSNIHKQVYSGVVDAIEDDRYYVILRAFDFQASWKRRKLRLLWETRFSLSQRRHDFGKDLPAMAQYASAYFGKESHGLVMKPVPEGRVDIGAVESLGEAPARENPGAGQAPAKP